MHMLIYECSSTARTEAFSSVLESQEECATIEENKTKGMTDGLEYNGEKCDEKAFGKEPADNSGAPTHDEFQEGRTLNSLMEDNIVESCASESVCSPSKLPPQLASNAPSASHAWTKV
ncbi:rho-associated protein kinase 1 [Abeliophyllum distichum]|uniref:Rho-associated protein kinase 1 n=1 Tax=Abeliophyllum distichum TaxID=126358 RepID=A0ABD1U3C0_9LAMI